MCGIPGVNLGAPGFPHHNTMDLLAMSGIRGNILKKTTRIIHFQGHLKDLLVAISGNNKKNTKN